MSPPELLVIDFSRDPSSADWGRGIVAALPPGLRAELVRGGAGEPWADRARDLGCPVILSGSDVTVPSAEAWFAGQCAELRSAVAAGVPLFGICFGAQLIAQALGGVAAVRRAARGEFGVTSIAPSAALAGDPVLGRSLPADRPSRVYNLHADEVDPDAARRLGLAVLAASPDCAVQAFRIPDRKVWGVQFHPELTGEKVASLAAGLAAEFGNATTDAAGLAALTEGSGHRRPDMLEAFLAAARGG